MRVRALMRVRMLWRKKPQAQPGRGFPQSPWAQVGMGLLLQDGHPDPPPPPSVGMAGAVAGRGGDTQRGGPEVRLVPGHTDLQ